MSPVNQRDRHDDGHDDAHDKSVNLALDRLRDRTDELELIISSLTTLALFSMPGWLYGKFADVYTHLSTGAFIAGAASTRILTGVCYGLGACFVFHLMARAYWVGLIGLKAAFPEGINWRRTRMLGPLTRRDYRRRLPDIDSIIRSTDRLASSLFAVISMLTIGFLWFGTLLVGVIVLAGVIGSRIGYTNSALLLASALLFGVFFGAPLLAYLIDAQLVTRRPRLRRYRLVTGTVRMARRVTGLAYPQRLILPVQLTLQTNTRPVAFLAVMIVSVFAILTVGGLRTQAWQNFTLSEEFTYLGTDQLEDGFKTAYYEDMPSPKDALRAWPRVSSFVQGGTVMRLFLPYQPLRDNLVLDALCDKAARSAAPVDCLRRLWSVSISGSPVPLASFLPAERSDIAMRGLVGLVPLEGLAPGIHRLEVVWNPLGADTMRDLDDRYEVITRRFVVPIAFAPDYEASLEAPP